MPTLTGPVTSDDSWQGEQFSEAYVAAVASVAGCTVEWHRKQQFGVDGTLARPETATAVPLPKVDFELKCTSQDCVRETFVSFALDVAKYDLLRLSGLLVPRILVVVVVPSDVGDWAQHDENSLVIKRCGYWLSLRDLPAAGTHSTKTVHLPRTQVLDPAGVDGIMNRIGNRQDP